MGSNTHLNASLLVTDGPLLAEKHLSVYVLILYQPSHEKL